MTQQQFHSNINYLTNKVQSAYFKPEQIDAMQQLAQMSIFNDFMQDARKTGVVNSALNPFRAEPLMFYTTDTTSGRLTLPIGFLYTTALQTNQFNNRTQRLKTPSVKIFKEDELGDALDSQLCAPSNTAPIAVEQAGYIQFYPKQAQNGTLFYLRSPKVPRFAYTQNGRVTVYDPVNSTDPEWRGTEINLVIMKTAELLGLVLTDPNLVAKVSSDIANNFTSPVKI